MITKTVLGILLLISGHFVGSSIRDGYSFGQVVPPKKDLADVSQILGQWSGRDLPADDRLRDTLCARAGIDRTYRDDEGNEVLVHAVWTDDYLRIHFPEQCYRESGWDLLDSSPLEVQSPSGKTFPAKTLRFARDGREIQVLYWFELGEHYFLDRWQHRSVRRGVCWGRKDWPPLMKYMLESPSPSIKSGQEHLRDVAGRLHDASHAE